MLCAIQIDIVSKQKSKHGFACVFQERERGEGNGQRTEREREKDKNHNLFCSIQLTG